MKKTSIIFSVIMLVVFIAISCKSLKQPTMPATAAVQGSGWAQATGAAAFSPRGWFGSVVYNNKMWVIGGGMCIVTGSGNICSSYNDVWNG